VQFKIKENDYQKEITVIFCKFWIFF